MKTRTFKTGGIHVPELKDKLLGQDILTMPLPMQVSIMLKQHIGMAAVPIVKKGDKVVRGQKIAESRGRVGAPIHASISGTVKEIAKVTGTGGLPEDAIVIVADDADHTADMAAVLGEQKTYDFTNMTPEEIVATIADAGVVGLGGACFPTAIKLTPPAGLVADTLIINGAECEPYLTCDAALMCNLSDKVAVGIDLLRRGAKARRVIVGIEDNKPQAIAAMTEAVKAYKDITVQPLRTKYPQGGEKQLIYALTRRTVPSGGLPIDVGCIVQNIGTAYAVYMAIAHRQPLIERIITVGEIVNCMVAIGTPLSQVIAYAEAQSGARTPDDGEWDVVIGGPMMGRSAVSLDAPVVKGTSGVTYFKPLPYAPQPCIKCGECVRACPMGLEPYLLAVYGRKLMTDEASARGAMDCIECGSCNYSCPSSRPILDYIKYAKAGIRGRKR